MHPNDTSTRTFGHSDKFRLEYGPSAVLIDPVKYNTMPELREFVASGAPRRLVESVGFACIAVLGGDGAMLRAIRENYRKGLPFLGVNFGTKGFLLNDRRWFEGRPTSFQKLEYPLLHAEIRHEGHVSHKVAFNEVTVKSPGGHMVTLDLSLGGHSAMRLRGDGLLIATPAGSTGYNVSAHGPVLPHATPSLIATPLLTFEPRGVSPTVFRDQDEALIAHRPDRGQKVTIVTDSHVALHEFGGPVEVSINAVRGEVKLLVPTDRLVDWERRTYMEQGFAPMATDPDADLPEHLSAPA
jgi:NAD+ kinase